MRIFKVADRHENDRRVLTAFEPSSDFPNPVEAKVIVTKFSGVWLGNHSHEHFEGFFLVAGTCTVRTWTEREGVKDHALIGPIMFLFEPGEEHILTCSEGMILVGFMPLTFKNQHNTAATHI